MTWQLSLLEPGAPSGAAPVWDALNAEQRAVVVSLLVRLMAKQVGQHGEPAAGAEQESNRD